jgi:DNA (cytosine-5)-methyltransferase 1
MATKYTVIDLFAGCGGLALGFRRAGFKPIFAVEREPDFAKTYNTNLGPHCVADAIETVVTSGKIPKADVVVGGPPCQGFSNLTGNKRSDPRRKLWQYYMDVVEISECKVFVVENVPNFLTSPEGQGVCRRAKELGFHIGEDSKGLLLASNYGVPQNRRRAIIIASRLGPVALPAPTKARMTVRQALEGVPLRPTFNDLPDSATGYVTSPQLHIARNPTEISLRRYRLVPPGGNRFDLQRRAPELTPGCWIRKTNGGTDLFGRLDWDAPARCTIRCEFYKPEKGRYLHPSEHRPITHWEAARLQTFPDSFRWCGTKIRIAIQIGNAVPPKFAEVLGKTVHRHLDSQQSARTRDRRKRRSQATT